MFGKYLQKSVAYFGMCPKCMRTSFVVTLVSWAVSLMAMSLLSGYPLYGMIAITCLTTTIWVAHIIAYAFRQVSKIPSCRAKSGALNVPLSRREAIGKFSKLVVSAAVFTAFPTRAQGMYDCGPNPYANDRTGYGSCQQFCNTTKNERWDCPRGTRPVFLKNGGCTCCNFPECR